MNKRLGIYVHFDKKGAVGEYVVHCLKGLQELVSDILVVVNGELSDEGRCALQVLGVDILVRENVGFDFGGWKEGIKYYGYDKISNYDELILTNNSYYGPIYPFSEMWNKMDNIECDFWGINKHCKIETKLHKNGPTRQLAEHIQSYWLVFKKQILASLVFKSYWEKLPTYNNMEDAITCGEVGLSTFFESQGFKSASYMDCAKYEALIKGNPTFLSDIQVITDRCPIIKRKFFYAYKENFLNEFVGHGRVKRLLNFLSENNLYDVNMIWDDLLQSVPMSVINDSLHMNYILAGRDDVGSVKLDKKIACIIYIFHPELISYCYQYIKNIPQYIDIVIVNTSSEVLELCKSTFQDLDSKIEYRMQPNRGRDNAAFLVTCKDIINQYDYLCFVHSKVSAHNDDVKRIVGEEFRSHCFTSLLYSERYINDITNTLSENSRLGLLAPLPILWNYNLAGNEWGRNKSNSENYLKQYFSIDDIELDPHVMAPFGGMFWVKTKALKTLTSYDWKYEDFPSEPFPASDGLLPHSIERLISILAQRDGYFIGHIAPIEYASTYLGELYHFNRNKTLDMKPYLLLPAFRVYSIRALRIKYFRCKFLSKITWGKKQKHYKRKTKNLKNNLQLLSLS